MDVIELINKRVDFHSLLDKYNAKSIKEFNDSIRCCCPVHKGDNPSCFVYDLDKKVFFCHSCGCSGDAIQFVEYMEDCSFKKAVDILTSILNIDIEGIQIIEKKDRYAREIEQLKKLYKRKHKIIKEFDISRYELQQLSSYRDYDEDVLKEFNVSFAEKIESWNKRIVVPIVQNGKVVGVSTRRTIQDNSPKWVHLPDGIKTGDMLFNIDNCICADRIIVCEGIWDALKWHMNGFNAVCTFGAKLSDEQMKILIKTGADIILGYDNDDAGKKATEKALSMLKGKATVYTLNYNSVKDAGECSNIELIKIFNNKKKEI